VPSVGRNEINCCASLLIYSSHHLRRLTYYMLMPVKAYLCSRLTGGTAGSKPAEDMDVCFLPFSCVVYVAAYATSRSPGQRSPTGYVSECNCV